MLEDCHGSMGVVNHFANVGSKEMGVAAAYTSEVLTRGSIIDELKVKIMEQ